MTLAVLDSIFELWELTGESLHESFLNSHVLVKGEQELHKSWWELTSESLYESFLDFLILVKREQELMRVSTLVFWVKREFVWVYESFLNCYVLVKQQ